MANSSESYFSLMGFTSMTHSDYTRCSTISDASVWLCTHVHMYWKQCNDICSCFLKWLLKKGTSNSIQITNSLFSGEEAERLDRTRTSAEGYSKAQAKEVDCFFKVRSHKADGKDGG